jgi:2-oxoglutarate ferredoxin oxidoreductase subunit gamma
MTNGTTGQDKPEKKERRRPERRKKRAIYIEIRVSGSGGQGVISTGMMLGEAIALGDGLNVAQSQSYGPEARGGATRCDIVVSDQEIYFPECNSLDLLLAFTPEAYEKYAPLVKETGVIVAEATATELLLGQAPTVRVPFLETARTKLGRQIAANIIALGFLSTYAKIVSPRAIQDVVQDRFKGSKNLDLNMRAIEEGLRMGREAARGT